MIPETPTPMDENTGTCAGSPPATGSAAARGSALTDSEKIAKAIDLLQWLHGNCLVPALAHDSVNTCQICRLIAELKAPNDSSSGTA